MLYICRNYLHAFLSFSPREFRNDFLELLRRRFGEHLKHYAHNNFLTLQPAQGQQRPVLFLGTKRVHNNIVYNEYISHREHIHMNATQWETLTDFTKWLGREGKSKTHLNSGDGSPLQAENELSSFLWKFTEKRMGRAIKEEHSSPGLVLCAPVKYQCLE